MKNLTIVIGIVIILIAAIGFVYSNSGNTDSAPIKENIVAGETQKVLISQKNLNYYPNTINVKVGQLVSLSLDSSVTGCLRSFTIRDLGVQKNLRTPEDTLEFTPTQKGTFRFACSMGMGYGTLVVE